MAETYRALTRKYRPSTFDDIVSQEHVSNTLKNAIDQNRLSHAYLFSGPRGVGKTTMARVFARTINDLDQQVDGEHLSQTLNVVEIDAASNNKVDDVHHLRESVRIPPQNGSYKVFIIDEVHMLSKQAFNALLKTLEEPPDHAIFIFATTEPHKVLPTILSRVQRFDFKRIKVEEMVARLKHIAEKESITVDEEALHIIGKKADGALRDALGLMDQAIAFCGTTISHEELLRSLNVVSTDRLFEFVSHVKQRDADAGLSLINDLMQEGYDIQEFLVELTEHLRNMYIAHSGENLQLIEATDSTRKRYKKVASDFSKDDIMRMLHIVSEAQYKIREAHQPRILFEITMLKLIHMSKTEELTRLIAEVRSLKKKRHLKNEPVTDSPDNRVDKSRNGSQNGESQPQQQEPRQSADEEITAKSGEQSSDDNEDSDHQNKQTRDEPKTSQQDTSQYVGQDSQPQPEHDPYFGAPSLNKIPSAPQNQPVETDTIEQEQTQREKSSRAEPAPERTEPMYLHDVKEIWPKYLEELNKHIPKMLFLQMQRVEPVDLQNNVLTIRCNDAFAKRMIDENDTILKRTLKQICGQYVQLKCEVYKQKKDSSETMSPYERFKQLQEKDPKIRTIVELFGAELNY